MEAKATAKLEPSLRPFDEDRRLAERTAHFMADDHAAHGRRDDDVDLTTCFFRDASCERAGDPLGPGRVHEQARALQVAWAAETRREDEMAFEQRVRGAKFPQHFLFRHGSGNRRGNAPLQLPWNRRLRE